MRHAFVLAALLFVPGLAGGVKAGTFPQQTAIFFTTADGLRSSGAGVLAGGGWPSVPFPVETPPHCPRFQALLDHPPTIRQIAARSGRPTVVAAISGLYAQGEPGEWTALYPGQGDRSWAPHDVRAAMHDSAGWLWFAGPQGVGRRLADGASFLPPCYLGLYHGFIEE